MKQIALLLFSIFLLFSCKNDDDNQEALPPATQTGAGTFACYVNGTSYIDASGGYFNCFYQLVDGEYYFHIAGEDSAFGISEITIYASKFEIYEGENYELTNFGDYSIAALILAENSLSYSYTDISNPGTLTITKLDFENYIVSGVFEFDIIHPTTGEIIEIRDGRFDTLFTQ
ncbi:hypothetical protein GZ212_01315 [Mangrovimonas sp. CR14]|uniref:hypothetical protein n=1 Tax=Mangrovimonas sp. CR14 TaxID=2706120 RepID=UPI0014233EA9|nr:hypothetical protein [Mangrovimonas sp. CR14]NIK90774.1 hypothetical protein [Mangrovimonas sp. CR14]